LLEEIRLRLRILLFVSSAAGLMAQGPPTITGELKQNYTRTKDVLLRAAAKMPDEGYAFRPTAEVRTFAQVIGHISDAQAMMCGGVIGQTPKVDANKTAKADVVAELKKSFDVCDKAYDQLNEGNSMQVGGTGFMGGTMAGRLYGNLLHDNEMYGTIVVYLRLKGIVPPSSESRGR
jgi:hypothetical protein